ncbi:hypothetical protein GCM10009744_43920 [Kribbella alba]|uniref:Uncharacterized protein n=1 Tax=Kribbella alba TaxID=190197 RepID=A0ABP4RG04_9ACTN
MGSDIKASVDLYIAAYPDAEAARGGLMSHREEAAIKADVEDTLPPNSSHADKVTKHEVDADSTTEVRNAAKVVPRRSTPRKGCPGS